MAINWAALFYPGEVRHFVTMHFEQVLFFRSRLENYGYRKHGVLTGPRPPPGSHHRLICHSIKVADGVDCVWDPNKDFACNMNGGSSGCYAAAIVVKLGYEEIIHCGIPADDTGNFYDAPWVNDNFIPKRKVWKQAAETSFNGKVKSLSGWTKSLLEQRRA